MSRIASRLSEQSCSEGPTELPWASLCLPPLHLLAYIHVLQQVTPSPSLLWFLLNKQSPHPALADDNRERRRASLRLRPGDSLLCFMLTAPLGRLVGLPRSGVGGWEGVPWSGSKCSTMGKKAKSHSCGGRSSFLALREPRAVWVVSYLLLLNSTAHGPAAQGLMSLPSPCRLVQTCLMLLRRTPSASRAISDRWLAQLSPAPEDQGTSSIELTWLLWHLSVSLSCICHGNRHLYEGGIHVCRGSSVQAAW